MKWMPANEPPKITGEYHTNIGLVEWGTDGTGDPSLFWLNRRGGHVTKWLDESDSEHIYTEKEMIAFANEIGQEGFPRYKAGIWYTDPLNDRLTYTTESLLDTFIKTRIPTTIS